MSDLDKLLKEVRACTLCESELPLGPRPILRAAESAKILIVGQAPGTRVHETGIPWNDPSGDRLRAWLGCDKPTFYDETQIAIIPTGFCYPGKGQSGDLPPKKICAPTWHPLLLEHLPNIELILLIGQYAQAYYLKQQAGRNLTDTVSKWRDYLPYYLPLPHPSPRNQYWIKKNPWFINDVLPVVKDRFKQLINSKA